MTRSEAYGKARRALAIARKKRDAIYDYSWERDQAVIQFLKNEVREYVRLALSFRAQARG